MKTKEIDQIFNQFAKIDQINRNIPKGQFIRVHRICSDLNDFIHYGNRLIQFMLKRGYDNKKLQKTFNDIKKR